MPFWDRLLVERDLQMRKYPLRRTFFPGDLVVFVGLWIPAVEHELQSQSDRYRVPTSNKLAWQRE